MNWFFVDGRKLLTGGTGATGGEKEVSCRRKYLDYVFRRPSSGHAGQLRSRGRLC
jgi:hypothetical protein